MHNSHLQDIGAEEMARVINTVVEPTIDDRSTGESCTCRLEGKNEVEDSRSVVDLAVEHLDPKGEIDCNRGQECVTHTDQGIAETH